MANTGLLGFNPYDKGFNIDISSKPLNLALQLQQKEQAKKDALEKYFLDYEKSINPAGLSTGESDMFLKKFNDNKQFWIKNKEAILNPTKYGYEAQSQYLSNLKDQAGYIYQAKQATAERKAFSDYINKAKAEGKDISDNVIEMTANASNPVGAGYVPPDLSKIEIFKPHNPIDYLKELKNVKRISGTPKIQRVENYDIITNDEIPDLNEAKQIANSKLQTDKGYKKYIYNLAQDPQEIVGLGKIYEQRTGNKFNPQSIEDISLAYTLSGLPIEKTKPTYRTNIQAQSAEIQRRSEARGEYVGFNPYNAIQLMVDNGIKENKEYRIDYSKNPFVKGTEITLPSEVENDLFAKNRHGIIRPTYTVMDDNGKKLHLIYTDEKGNTDPNLTRTVNVDTDLVGSLGKNYGGTGWNKRNLWGTPTPSSKPNPQPTPKNKENKKQAVLGTKDKNL